MSDPTNDADMIVIKRAGFKSPPRFKLTPQQQIQLVQRIAMYYSTAEMVEWLRAEIHADEKEKLSNFITSYKQSTKWRPLIEKYRAEYEANIIEIPMASKRQRVQRYNDIHEKLYASGELDLAAKQLERIHNEVEGKSASDRPNIFITQFNQLTDEEIEERRLRIINDLERVRKTKGASNGGRKKETQQAETEEEVIEGEIIDASYTEGSGNND